MRQSLSLVGTAAEWKPPYIDMVVRTLPTAPCTIFLTPDEWQALYCRRMKTPTPPPDPPDCRAQTGVFQIAVPIG